MAKVKIQYVDQSSLSKQEIISQNKTVFGDTCSVTVLPDSDKPRDLIKFAIEELITTKQITSFYDLSDREYSAVLQVLEVEVFNLAGTIVQEVIKENEDKFT